MSGSDCGRVFVWDKWTGHIVNVLVGDRRVVNCAQPHPEGFSELAGDARTHTRMHTHTRARTHTHTHTHTPQTLTYSN